MWPIFTFSPYFIPLAIGIMQIFRLFGYITPVKNQTQKGPLKLAFETHFQPLIEFIYMFFGFLIIDIAIIWICGNWTYTDWRFHLPAVILGLFAGPIYLWRGVAIKPNLISLILKFVFFIGVIYLIQIELYNVNRLRSDFSSIFTWIGIIFVINWILEIVIHKLENKDPKIKVISPLWDSSNQYKKWNTLRFDIILYAMAILLAILNFESLSLIVV